MRKTYKCILEDTNGVYRFYRTANSKKDFIKEWSGNGDIISIEDVTNDFYIDGANIRKVLRTAGYHDNNIDVILSILSTYENYH
jgi:hypothetical protein